MTSQVDQKTKTTSSELLAFKSNEEYQNYINNRADRVVITYHGGVYDVTDFLESHPGGDEIIKDCNGRDVSDLMHNSYPHTHSTAAIRMLAKYKIGYIEGENDGNDGDNSGSLKGSSKESQAYPVVMTDYIQYKDFRMSRKHGFIPQIFGLSKEQYLDFIHHPLHLDECKLFTWKFFEFFTRNKWWYIPIAWSPMMLYFFIVGITSDYGSDRSFMDPYIKISSPDFSLLALSLVVMFGVFLWTLSEYMLHRYLFHLPEGLMLHPVIRWFHFMIHGIHHLIPMDPERLVFPPPLGFLIGLCIFAIQNFVFGGNLSRILYFGTMLGYVFYDIIHWWLHHGNGGLEYFKGLKRYHNLHHFFEVDLGYGISTKFWDYVFGTVITIKEQKVAK